MELCLQNNFLQILIYIEPGFNEYAKELHKEARSCFIAWKSLGKPRAGLCYTDMCQSRLIGYEPADLTVHPPPQNDREWVHFFRMGV